MNRNSWCLWRSYLHGHLIGVPVAMLCMFCAPARHSKFPYSHGEEWALLGCISSALKAEMLKMWMGCSLCLWVSCVPWSWSQSLPGARLSSKPLRAAVATYNFGTACKSDWGAMPRHPTWMEMSIIHFMGLHFLGSWILPSPQALHHGCSQL